MARLTLDKGDRYQVTERIGLSLKFKGQYAYTQCQPLQGSQDIMIDPLTRLKQRKPWAGHIGQRALLPGSGMRAWTENGIGDRQTRVFWMAILLVVGIAFSLALTIKDGTMAWIGWICGVGLYVLLVEHLRVVAWTYVACPLNESLIRQFKAILEQNPPLMTAAMHWLQPDSKLRIADLRLARKAERYLLEKEGGAGVEPLVDLDERARLLESFKEQAPSEIITARAAELAARHTKPFRPGGWMAMILRRLTTKTSYWYRDPETGFFDCFVAAVRYYLLLVALSFLGHGWMGVRLGGADTLHPFGVVGSVMLLTYLSIRLAVVLARKRIPLSMEDLAVMTDHAIVLKSKGASYQYLSRIPADHDWSTHDIRVAWELDQESNRECAKAGGSSEEPYTSKTPLSPLDPTCPMPAQKPWRGHLGQRMLMPSRKGRELGDDLLERPRTAAALAGLVVLALFVPIGALVTVSEPFSWIWFCGTILALLQIEIMRLIGYLLVSAPSVGGIESSKIRAIIGVIPGAAGIVARWGPKPGLRLHDVRVLKAWADRCNPGAKAHAYQCATGEYFDILHPGQDVREKLLGDLRRQPVATSVDERARRQAQAARAPLDVWGWLGGRGRVAWQFFDDFASLFFSEPRAAALLWSVLLVLGYMGACGLLWAVSGSWSDAQGWQVVFPLGAAGTLELVAIAAGVVGIFSWVFWHSIAPRFIIDRFAEQHENSSHAGWCLDYLGYLPAGQCWTFGDLLRSRAMTEGRQRVVERERAIMEQERGVMQILSTQEALVGMAHVQSEQMQIATIEVAEAVTVDVQEEDEPVARSAVRRF